MSVLKETQLNVIQDALSLLKGYVTRKHLKSVSELPHNGKAPADAISDEAEMRTLNRLKEIDTLQHHLSTTRKSEKHTQETRPAHIPLQIKDYKLSEEIEEEPYINPFTGLMVFPPSANAPGPSTYQPVSQNTKQLSPEMIRQDQDLSACKDILNFQTEFASSRSIYEDSLSSLSIQGSSWALSQDMSPFPASSSVTTACTSIPSMRSMDLQTLFKDFEDAYTEKNASIPQLPMRDSLRNSVATPGHLQPSIASTPISKNADFVVPKIVRDISRDEVVRSNAILKHEKQRSQDVTSQESLQSFLTLPDGLTERDVARADTPFLPKTRSIVNTPESHYSFEPVQRLTVTEQDDPNEVLKDGGVTVTGDQGDLSLQLALELAGTMPQDLYDRLEVQDSNIFQEQKHKSDNKYNMQTGLTKGDDDAQDNAEKPSDFQLALKLAEGSPQNLDTLYDNQDAARPTEEGYGENKDVGKDSRMEVSQIDDYSKKVVKHGLADDLPPEYHTLRDVEVDTPAPQEQELELDAESRTELAWSYNDDDDFRYATGDLTDLQLAIKLAEGTPQDIYEFRDIGRSPGENQRASLQDLQVMQNEADRQDQDITTMMARLQEMEDQWNQELENDVLEQQALAERIVEQEEQKMVAVRLAEMRMLQDMFQTEESKRIEADRLFAWSLSDEAQEGQPMPVVSTVGSFPAPSEPPILDEESSIQNSQRDAILASGKVSSLRHTEPQPLANVAGSVPDDSFKQAERLHNKWQAEWRVEIDRNAQAARAAQRQIEELQAQARRDLEFLQQQDLRRREDEERQRQERERRLQEAETKRRQEEEQRRQLEQQRREAEEAARRARLLDCAVCSDEYDMDLTVRFPCNHAYCRECLTQSIKTAVQSKAAFRCCNHRADTTSISRLLPTTLVNQYTNLVLELDTPNPTYCSSKKCSSFIPPPNIKAGTATCPKCHTRTCANCKRAAHPDICAEDKDGQALLALGNQKHWMKCPHCNNMVERSSGCLHMTCRCGTSFCYSCGQRRCGGTCSRSW